MKFRVGLTIMLLISGLLEGQAQLQNNNWVFGRNFKVHDLNTTPAPKAEFYHGMEGVVSVSDPISGALLFYSNGEAIFNQLGDTMLNGNNLAGDMSSCQGALALPNPTKQNQYLLFTTPFFNEEGSLCYSLVDMSLDNGNGAVVPNQKNIKLLDAPCESLTYFYNEDSSAYWLVVHERDNYAFVSIRIDEQGIGQKKVQSELGRIWDAATNYMAMLKSSPDGKTMAVSHIGRNATDGSFIELYDFDPCTGELSNIKKIEEVPKDNYGCEFSPDGRFLYYSNYSQPSQLIQVDISTRDENAMLASKVVIATAPEAPASQNRNTYYTGLQRHPNGKIYLSEIGNNGLHCINNPNQKGAAANYQANQLTLNAGICQYGLPQLVPVRLNKPRVDSNRLNILLSDSCQENSIGIKTSFTSHFDTASWVLENEMGDTLSITFDDSLVLRDLEKGYYFISFFGRANCQSFYSERPFALVDCNCDGELQLLDSCVETGVKVALKTDYTYSSIDWLLSDSLGQRWEKTADTLTDLTPTGSFDLQAIIKYHCGADTQFLQFSVDSCYRCDGVFVPTAFSPNGDGLNDVYQIRSLCQMDTFHFRIFNRWGQRIYTSNNPNKVWDGTFKGADAPVGLYVYVMSYRTIGRRNNFKQGSIQLVR